MKRGLLFGVLGLGVLGAGWLSFSAEETAQYTPRGRNAEQIHGAMEYIHMLRANQITGEVSVQDIMNARNAMNSRSNKASLGLSWENMGPDNFGGRTRAILVDKDSSNVIYSGSVSGGLFKSYNSGASWNLISPADANNAIVSICQTANGDLYYGTGEFMFINYFGNGPSSTPAFYGGGIYKSTDHGQTWSVLSSTVPTSQSTSSEWAAVARLQAHPTNPQTLYAGTNTALKKSTDGGATWTNLYNSAVRDFSVAGDGSVWMETGGRVYYSPDGSTTASFTEISKPAPGGADLPRGNSAGRTRFAISPQDNDVVYVVQVTGAEALSGVYRSADRGVTWSKIGSKGANFDPLCSSQCQGKYDLLFAVSPKDKNRIWLGGITLWTWSNTAGWSLVNTTFPSPGNIFYLHSDQHEMVFDPKNPNIAYVTNDGGIFRTGDHGTTWYERNANYSTLQYYNFGVGPDRTLIGGTQDNGTQLITGKGNTAKAGTRLLINGSYADGGQADISWLKPSVMFAENQNGDLGRSSDGGETFLPFYSAYVTEKFGSAWIMPYQLWESVTDSMSVDSVEFEVTAASTSLGFGNGVSTQFSGTLNKPQASAQLVASTFKIEAGALLVTSDASGTLSGDGTGTFDAATGAFTVNFSSVPQAEIIVNCQVQYTAGSVIEYTSAIGLPIKHVLTTNLNQNDKIQLLDPVQSQFIVGTASGTNGAIKEGGIWMTREVHDFSKTPTWWKIAHLGSGTPLCMDMTKDGNTLYLGTTNGAVWRISNILAARTRGTANVDSAGYLVEVQQIATYGGRSVTDISVDPNNGNRVAIALGNYGNNTYVYVSNNALAASPTFVSKQGDLPQMPCYSVSWDKLNANYLYIGTEMGLFATDNINATSVSWSEENVGMSRVPVFAIEQYRTDNNWDTTSATSPLTEGDIFIATHGRGYFRTTNTMVNRPVGQDEQSLAISKESLNIYPNPATTSTRIAVDITSTTDVKVSVRDLNGRLVKQVSYSKLPAGVEYVKLNVEGMKSGAYLVTVQAGNTVKSGKLIVTK